MVKELNLEASSTGNAARMSEVLCGHTDRPYYAKSQCRRCYQKIMRRQRQIRK